MKLVKKEDHRVTSKPWKKRQQQYSRSGEKPWLREFQRGDPGLQRLCLAGLQRDLKHRVYVVN